MGMFLSEVLIDSKRLNKSEYINYVSGIIGCIDPDYNFDNLNSADGYEVLPIYDEKKDCIKIGIDIANKFNVLTISIYVYDSDFAVFQLVDGDVYIVIVFNKKLALSYDYDKLDQNVDLLINYVDSSISKDDIKRIINEEYIFAEDGLSKILELFHIDYNELLL